MKVIAPNRADVIVEEGLPSQRMAQFMETLARLNNDIDQALDSYTVTNAVTRRTFDPTTVTTQELAEVVSTLITDIRG